MTAARDWSLCWCVDDAHAPGDREGEPGAGGGVRWRTKEDAERAVIFAPGRAHLVRRVPDRDELGPVTGLVVVAGLAASLVAAGLVAWGLAAGRGDVAVVGAVALLALVALGYGAFFDDGGGGA